MIAEILMRQTKIVFVVNGNRTIGMGHVYRALNLANLLIGHDLTFVTYSSDKQALDLILSHKYRVIETSEKLLVESIKNVKPSIVINDILDTESEYINDLIKAAFFVTNF